MFRKICNYFAVFSLSLAVGGSALANPVVVPSKIKTVVIEKNNDFKTYTEVLGNGDKLSYNVKVEAGKEVRIKFNGSSAAKLKIQTPNGETQTYSQDKNFYITLHAEGEYVVELESITISQYTLKFLNR